MRVDTGRLRVVGGEALAPAHAEDGAPPSPGAYIREHRERRGLSLEELAVATKVPRDSLELVEADRFEELPGMVFAKGFLRCCARVLELDEDTVLGLLYERERRGNSKSKRESTAKVVPVPASNASPKAGASPSVEDKPNPAPPRHQESTLERWASALPAWVAGLRERVTMSRLLLWVLVALFVFLVVFLAFTIASGQGKPEMRL